MFTKYCCIFTQIQIILREMVTRWCMLVTSGFVKHVRLVAIQHMVLCVLAVKGVMFVSFVEVIADILYKQLVS